ncbi:MAG TPA: PLP-dependent aminotransferase family protein, partial [Kofleriaceae bacterium]|nr:PLP-dependent aminotransferase family protein [Kofleriaceae bacterium]
MPRRAPEPTLLLGRRPPRAPIGQWLYDQLRAAILAGTLPRGARLPATRDLAVRHGVSRGVVVGVFEQLRDEGYLTSRVGAGTTVRPRVPEDYLTGSERRQPPVRRDSEPAPVRPFCPIEPAVTELPMKVWARLYARVLSRMSARMLSRGTPAGSRQLREAVAGHLAASRGVACAPEQIVIVSGVQQALDLFARAVIRPGDRVWMEDPGYSGAVDAFRNARARIVPVRVDDDGLDPADGRRRCPRPRAVYLTPAHQFCLGSSLSLERRLELLRWASTTGALLVEDDYDSEFRFSGRPLPALRGLGGAESVFLLGTFNKVLFPALRLGYMVVPDAWIDRILALRYQTDLYPPAIAQAVLAAFIEEGHLARHLRRMRERYGGRLAALLRAIERRLGGALRVPEIQAGLNTPAYLPRGASPRAIVERGARHGLDLWSLDRYALERRDLRGLLLGFAA